MAQKQQGIRFAICSEWLEPYITSLSHGSAIPSLETVFLKAQAIGVDGVEIAPHTFAPMRTPDGRFLTAYDFTMRHALQIRELAERYQLAVTGLHWLLSDLPQPDLGLTPPIVHQDMKYRPHITSDDSMERLSAARYLNALTMFSRAIGGRVNVLGSPKQRNYRDAATLDEDQACIARQHALDTLVDSGVARCANDLGIVIALEPLASLSVGGETNFWSSSGEVLKFLEECYSSGKSSGAASLQMMLDIKAMQAESKATGRSIPEIIADVPLEILSHIHANVNLWAPGKDTHHIVNFVDVFRALLKKGYLGENNGWVSVEPFAQRDKNIPQGRLIEAQVAITYLRECYRQASS